VSTMSCGGVGSRPRVKFKAQGGVAMVQVRVAGFC
jgi:hypothetical protein